MTNAPRKLTTGQIALMAAIDVAGLLIGVSLYIFMQSRDPSAAILAFVSPLVFAGFFNLVIVLVSLKP